MGAAISATELRRLSPGVGGGVALPCEVGAASSSCVGMVVGMVGDIEVGGAVPAD